jgi:hypothetical protein
MALTFTDWEHYTDEEGAKTLNWSSADAIRGYPLRPHAEAVRQAIVERYKAANFTVPATLDIEVPPAGPTLAAWAAAVQSAVTYLIGAYCPYLSDYNGAADIPNYTEAAILAAIGADSRLGQTGFPSADWIFQQYQILPLLFFRKFNLEATASIRDRQQRQRPGSTWPDAIAAFNAQAWGSGSAAPRHYGYFSSPFYGIFRNKYTLRVLCSYSNSVANTYRLFTRLISPASGTYQNNDYPGAEEGKVFTLASGVLSLIPGDFIDVTVGDFGDNAITESPPPDIGWATDPAWWGVLGINHNVPGGFIFQ